MPWHDHVIPKQNIEIKKSAGNHMMWLIFLLLTKKEDVPILMHHLASHPASRATFREVFAMKNRPSGSIKAAVSNASKDTNCPYCKGTYTHTQNQRPQCKNGVFAKKAAEKTGQGGARV